MSASKKYFMNVSDAICPSRSVMVSGRNRKKDFLTGGDMQELPDADLDDESAEDWAEEFVRPYTRAKSALLAINSCWPVSGGTIKLLTEAEDYFWAFICEFELREDETGRIFNLYLEQTMILRTAKDMSEEEKAGVALKCLGLGLLILARMDEIYSIWFGLTWKLDHGRFQGV